MENIFEDIILFIFLLTVFIFTIIEIIIIGLNAIRNRLMDIKALRNKNKEDCYYIRLKYEDNKNYSYIREIEKGDYMRGSWFCSSISRAKKYYSLLELLEDVTLINIDLDEIIIEKA